MNRSKVITILDQIIEYGFYILIFFLPVSKAFIESSAGFIIAAFLVKKALAKDFTNIKSDKTIFLILLTFFLFGALSLINSGPFLLKSLRALFFKWGEYLLLFTAAVDHFKNERSLRRFFYVLLLSAAVIGISALSQNYFGVEFLRHRSMHGPRVTGPFENPNCFSAYLAICLPIIIALACWRQHRKALTAAILLVCLILVASLSLSMSRSGWLGFVVGTVLAIFLLGRKTIPLLILGAFLLHFVSFSFPSHAGVQIDVESNPGVQRVVASFAPEGDSLRFTIWKGAVAMIEENPFLGKGIGTFMDHFADYVPGIGVHYAHNCYLQIWAETGIFSLITFLLLIGFVLYRGVRLSLKNQFDDFGVLLGGLTGGVLGFLIASLFDTEFYSLQLSALFWVMFGVMVAVERMLSDRMQRA